MAAHLQLFAIAASLFLLLVVLELVRRRRLFERYAILWLLSAIVLIGLAVWADGLNVLSRALGIAAPPNALFVIALGFVLVLLLHFSVAVSRLSDQSTILAQRLALLEERLGRVDGRAGGDRVPGQPTPPARPVSVAADAPTAAPAEPSREPVAIRPAGQRGRITGS